MDPLWQQINEAVQRKDHESVRALIPKYLRRYKKSPDAIYEASEFYRKIWDYKSALRLLPKERTRTTSKKLSDEEIRLELQTARILNMLGASHYALRIVERIRAGNWAKSKVEMAEIYHCNCRPDKVLQVIGTDFALPEKEPWHQDWVLHFYYAYALNATKKMQQAIDHLDGIHALSSSPLIRAIALTYKGQFLVEGGFPEKALPLLQEAKRFFHNQGITSDDAILYKWLGICFFKLKKYNEAEAALRESFRILYQPSLKPEDWMELVLWLDRIPGLKKTEQMLAPRLWSMEGPESTPLTEVGISAEWGDEYIFSISKIEKSRGARHIDRASDMAWQGKSARLGLDLVDELIWNLVYAGEYGLPQYKLYELLWPKEAFSFDQQAKRLERLVQRARETGYEIAWESLHLRLLSKDVTVSGRPKQVVRGRPFLIAHPVFSRKDVEKYFSVSQATAISICREWIGSSLVVSISKFQYRSNKICGSIVE